MPPAPCYPPQFGCDGDAAVKYNYDPAKAKALLAEAGFPERLRDRPRQLCAAAWGAAVQNYLGAVGIKANLVQLQVAAAIERATKGQNPLVFWQLGLLLDQ